MAAPKGNKFAAHDKPWTNALQRVLAQLELRNEQGLVTTQPGEALRQIAEVTVMRALAGDKDARKEIADRLDGKPTEYVNVQHRADPGKLTDEQLADIASGSGARAAQEARGTEIVSLVH